MICACSKDKVFFTAILAGNETFLTENISQDRKRFITQSKHKNDILIKSKRF